MKCGIFLLAAFACLLKEVLTTKIDHVQEIESNPVSHIKKRSTSAELLGKETCYKDFESDETLLLEDFQNKMVNCKQDAENISSSIRQLRVEAAEKVHSIQESLNYCNLIGHPSEYLECVKNFGIKSRAVFDEIDGMSTQFRIEIDTLQQKEQSCLKQSLDQSKLKSQTSFFEMKRCLQIKSNSTVSYLDELQEIYKNLHDCINIEKDPFTKCMQRANKTLNENHFRGHFKLSAPQYYKELSKIDQDNDSCIRHFITEYIYPEFKSKFSLHDCLYWGLRRVTNLNSGDLKPEWIIFFDFLEIRKKLYRCALVTSGNNNDEDECASEILKKSDESIQMQMNIHSMPEEYFKSQVLPNILANLENETVCISHIFEALQSEGLFMDIHARYSLKQCLRTQSKSVPSFVVIDRLKEIANSITKCCISISGDNVDCIDDALFDSKISLDYITTEPRFSKDYSKNMAKYYSTILDNYKEPHPYTKIRNAFHCLKNQK